MPEVGSWKDWLLQPLRSRFGAAPEPWQARPPPSSVEPQVEDFPPLSTEELALLGLKPEQAKGIEPYNSTDSEDLRFLDWETVSGERRAVFRVEDDENPLGYRFSRLRYGEVLTTAALSAMMWRPDEDLKALRTFHQRFGEPTEADLSDAVAHLRPSPQTP